MPHYSLTKSILSGILLLLVGGCGGGSTDTDSAPLPPEDSPTTQPPTISLVDTEADELSTFTLSADVSIEESSIESYQWQYVSGMELEIVSGQETNSLTLKAPELETSNDSVYSLTVTDDGGNESTAESRITLHNNESRSFIFELQNLEYSKIAFQTEQDWVQVPVQEVLELAEKWYQQGPYSVTFNAGVSQYIPDASPNDFATTGNYWWPNPNTADGLPFILRDGFGNPDSNGSLIEMKGAALGIYNNALAFYLTEEERYAEQAAELARTFFTDEATAMTPHSEFGKVVPGVNEDGGFVVAGIGNMFRLIYDGLGLIEGAKAWTIHDRRAMQSWSAQFLDWMETSEKGQVEFESPSNHGTNFDMIASLLSLYNEDQETALRYVSNYAENRIPNQFAEDGTQPYEFGRTDNLNYAEYNLRIAFDIAGIAENLDYDVWNYTTSNGAGLRNSTDFLIPYFLGELEWNLWPTNNQNFPMRTYVWHDLLQRAAYGFDNNLYIELADLIEDNRWVMRTVNLTHPVKVAD